MADDSCIRFDVFMVLSSAGGQGLGDECTAQLAPGFQLAADSYQYREANETVLGNLEQVLAGCSTWQANMQLCAQISNFPRR